MRLINLISTDMESFKYSVFLYIYYYNIKHKKEWCKGITVN